MRPDWKEDTMNTAATTAIAAAIAESTDRDTIVTYEAWADDPDSDDGMIWRVRLAGSPHS